MNAHWKMTSTLCHPLMVAACLLVATWEVSGDQQVRRLKTSDGAPVCAQNEPSRRAKLFDRMPDAPAVVACGMTCTADYQCRHFNYVATDPLHPCHLYYYEPTAFQAQPNCLHYHAPSKLYSGLQLFLTMLERAIAMEPFCMFVRLSVTLVIHS